MAFLAPFMLLQGFAFAQAPTATSPLIINQGPTYSCYSWYAELSDAGGYPGEAEWNCPYSDHVGCFTLGTNGWNYTYYEQTPGFNGSVNGAQGSPLTVALHNDARGASCSNRELAFTYDFPTQALYANVSTLDLCKWDSVVVEFDVNVITTTSDRSDCTCLDSNGKASCPDWWKTQFTTDILYWWGEEQHDSGDYNVISVRHLDPQNYGFWTWTAYQPGQDHYGHRIQYTDHQASPGQKSHVTLDIKHLIHKYSSQLCQGGGIQGPIHLNSVQFVLINTGSETNLEFSNVKANAFNFAPGQFTSTAVTPGCTPTNCPTQPTNTAFVCGTDPAQPPGSVTTPPNTPCATPQTIYGQCGGSGWTGPTCCSGGASCQAQNSYYAQCLTTGGNGGSPTTTTTTTTSPGNAPCPAQQTMYGQCGGSSWSGSTCCPSGTTCQVQNEYYSQCLP